MDALKNIPPIVWFGVGALMLSSAAQQTAQGINTAGTGALKLGGSALLGVAARAWWVAI
jgi:hypothetical protein